MLCVSYLQTPQNIRVGNRLPCVQTLAGRVQRVGNIHVDLAQEDVLKIIVDEKLKKNSMKMLLPENGRQVGIKDSRDSTGR